MDRIPCMTPFLISGKRFKMPSEPESLPSLPQKSDSLQYPFGPLAHAQVGLTGPDLGEVGRQSALVMADRHLVIIQDDQHIGALVTGVGQRFNGHPTGNCTIANDGDNLALLVFLAMVSLQNVSLKEPEANVEINQRVAELASDRGTPTTEVGHFDFIDLDLDNMARQVRSYLLIKPFPKRGVYTQGDWYLVCREEKAGSPDIEIFRHWLFEQIKADPTMPPVRESHFEESIGKPHESN